MMLKANKVLSLVVVIFLVLNNLAFAQYTSSDPRGDITVYPAKMGSKESEMMERFHRGELSEEQMRAMSKSKFGDKFSEMEFQRDMIKFEERMDRKETFSYEHEGFERSYYVGPSYEGYSKEHMIFGMIFEHIGDDIDPREIKQYCTEPEKIADIIINKLKEKVGDLQKLCSRFEEHESKCAEMAKKGCSQLGVPFVREDASEMEKLESIAYSCPVNKDVIVQACKKRSKFHMEQRIKNAAESCEKRFDFEGERLVRECQRFREHQICNKDEYIKRCTGSLDFKREGEYRCGEYRRDGTSKKVCATCGDSICEQYEKCTSSSCSGDTCTSDCGQLYCPKDCEGLSSENIGTKSCPEPKIPECEAGTTIQKKVDSNGCIYYYCEKPCAQENQLCAGIAGIRCCSGLYCKMEGSYPDASGVCLKSSGGDIACTQDVKLCPDGSYVGRVPPKCEFGTCPTTILECGSGSFDSNCVCPAGYKKEINQEALSPQTVYRCVTVECSQVSIPTCNADEILQKYYDSKGCITSYACVKQYAGCPEVSRVTCSEGQSLTTKYDYKGCIVGYECISVSNSGAGQITGSAIGSVSTYNEILQHCETSWLEQQRICSNIPDVCDKSAFIERCKEQERKNYDDLILKLEQHCASQSMAGIKHAEQKCSRLDEERERCFENSKRRCEQMKGLAQQCKELLTEENLKKFMIEEAKKRCKFTGLIEDEDDIRKAEKVEIILAVLNTATQDDIDKLELFIDNLHEELKLQDTTVYKGIIEPNMFGDIKLLPFVVNAKISTVTSSERAKEVKTKIVARQKVEEAASKLVSLRDSDVPNEYLYIIEDKASDVLNVSEQLEEIENKEEQKGFGYKIRLFLGLAKKAEQEEIKQLGQSKSKLQNSIEILTKLIDEVPSDVAKAVLKEQVESLKERQSEIEVIIEAKEKKAKGWFGIFG